MNKPLTFAQRLVSLGGLAALVVAIWFGVVLPVQRVFENIDKEIAGAEATKMRVERAIFRLTNAPQASGMPEGILWEGVSVNLIQADFQRNLGEMAAQNQVTFSSLTPLAIGDISNIATVALRVEGMSSYTNLISFINTALSTTPQIAISAFSIRQLPQQPNTAVVPVSFQLTFWAAVDVRAGE